MTKENKYTCPYCHSTDIGAWNKKINRYICKSCGKTFTIHREISGEIVARISEGMTELEVNYTTNEDRIRIVPIGDIHVGAPKGQCDWNKLLRELEYILKTPNTYMIGMGDYMDCAQKMSISRSGGGPNLFQSSLSPMEQYNLIEEAFRPLAKKGKIIGLHAGNHEEWIFELSGIQIIDLLCRSLNVPYLGSGCDITIGVNKQKYTFYTQHGASGAKFRHTKLGALMSATKDIFSEVFLYGHVHQLGVQKGAKRISSNQYKTYYILTGHFLNWEGGYAQAFGYDVCPSGCVQIKLFADRKDIHVSI